jgi:hypothetical protein
MDVDDFLVTELEQISLIDTEPLSTTLFLVKADNDDILAYDGGSEEEEDDDSFHEASESESVNEDVDYADDLEMYLEMEYSK